MGTPPPSVSLQIFFTLGQANDPEDQGSFQFPERAWSVEPVRRMGCGSPGPGAGLRVGVGESFRLPVASITPIHTSPPTSSNTQAHLVSPPDAKVLTRSDRLAGESIGGDRTGWDRALHWGGMRKRGGNCQLPVHSGFLRALAAGGPGLPLLGGSSRAEWEELEALRGPLSV